MDLAIKIVIFYF